MHPSDFTPRFIVTLGGDLTIHCPTCREGRGSNLRGPRFAKRLDQPVRDMKFRCKVCGTEGAASTMWHDSEGKWSYNFATGENRECSNPSIYRM